MTIENFYTAQVSSSASAKSANAQGKTMAKNILGELGFFDLFLQNNQALLDKNTKNSLDTPLSELNEGKDLPDLLQALAVSEDVEDELAKLDNPTLADIIALNQKELEKDFLSINDIELENGQEAEVLKDSLLLGDEELSVPALNNLHRLLKAVENLSGEESPSLIASNLTPQAITDLKERIEKILAGIKDSETAPQASDDYSGFMLGLIKLLPPKAKNDFFLTGKAILMSDSAEQTIGIKDLSARLGKLGDSLGIGTPWDDAPSDADFESFLEKFLKDAKSKPFGEELSFGKTKANDNGMPNAQGVKADALTSVLKGWPFGNAGTLFNAPELSSSMIDQLGLSAASPHGQISSLGTLTSLVTQSHAATQPHPGTQMVAAQLQKTASTGESKNIRIQLDPPELGRVEIRMSFGKDKGVKAILSAEKPETYMMLQRDAHVLERALQEAGLDADSSSLSFELAQDNQNFNQNGSHDGSRNQAKGQNSASGDEEIIETTMTWHVDQDTGHMRYNLLV